MRTTRTIAGLLLSAGLAAGGAPARGQEKPPVAARDVVREALAARASIPVAAPVLPVLAPGGHGESHPGKDVGPAPSPRPGDKPGAHETPAGHPQGANAPPGDHGGAHAARGAAASQGARDAHRIRADAANRAAAGAAANGGATGTTHADETCHDAAESMRSMGMDPEHTDGTHHGGMMPGSGTGTGGTMPGHQ